MVAAQDGTTTTRRAVTTMDPSDDKDEDHTNKEGGDRHRSERKRKREKQRRSDLSTAFEELGSFLTEIEPGLSEGDRKRKGKRSSEAEQPPGITRLDLISQGLVVMKRLYRENKELKEAMEKIRRAGPAALGPVGVTRDNNVLVMVPSLAPIEDPRITRSVYPSMFYPTSLQHPATSAAAASAAITGSLMGAPGSRAAAVAAAEAEAWARHAAAVSAVAPLPHYASGPLGAPGSVPWSPPPRRPKADEECSSPTTSSRPPHWYDGQRRL